MLAEHIGVHILGIQPHVGGQPGAQAGGIQHRTRADDLLFRQVGRLEDGIGDDVHRIAHYDINRVVRKPGDLGHYRLDNVDVGLREIDAGLARAWRAMPTVTITMSESAASSYPPA